MEREGKLWERRRTTGEIENDEKEGVGMNKEAEIKG